MYQAMFDNDCLTAMKGIEELTNAEKTMRIMHLTHPYSCKQVVAYMNLLLT